MDFSSTLSGFLGSWLGRGDRSAVVALDVSPKVVRSLHVRSEGTQLVLDGYRIVRGVGESRTMAGGLREALEIRLAKEPVVVSINSPDVTIRRIEVPPMSAQELREALPWEARRHIAGLADDAVLDAQILAGPPAGSAGPRGPMSVVLVAFPRPLYEGLSIAGLDLDVDFDFVDVAPLSAMNGLLRYRTSFEDGPLALLDLGSPLAWFSIFTDDDLVLFRDLAQRAEEIDQAIAAAFNLDAAQVESFRVTGKVPKGEAPNAAALQKALGGVIAELVEDLRSANIFLESRASASLERVHLSGAYASMFERNGIAEAISAQSGVMLERWNPLQGFRIGLVDEIGLRAASGELSAAAGLVARFTAGE
jgi:Tfp pilus assembly PilM family ATPase